MLVRIGGVVLLGDVVAEEDIGQRLEAMGVVAGDVDRHRVLVADVLAEGLTRLAIEDDDAGGALEAGKKVVLPAHVVVKATDHALAREREVRLQRPLRQRRLAPQLHQPASSVLDAVQRDAHEAIDHDLFAPWARTKSLTA